MEKSNNKVVVKGKKYYLHEVKRKETLFSICKAYKVNMQEVMHINGKAQTSLEIGEILRIPETTVQNAEAVPMAKKDNIHFTYHVVRQGETLYSLSKKYQVELDTILTVNPNQKSFLSIGDTLLIPKAKEKVLNQKPLLSQTPKTDSDYYYHKVQPGETESSISEEYNMKARKFRRLNPQFARHKAVEKEIFVRIPLHLAMKKTKSGLHDEIPGERKTSVDSLGTLKIAYNRKKINLALLLPFYLDMNDSINGDITYKDTVKVIQEEENRSIYSRSLDFIRFYQGILIAVDTLKKQGISVDLHVYDTERSKEKVEQILSRPELSGMDLIIGPVYSNTFALAADFALDYQIPIISPLSAQNPKLQTNPFVLQINTSVITLCQEMANYVMQNFSKHNLVVIQQEENEYLNEYKLITDIEKRLFQSGNYWQNSHISYKKIAFDTYGLYGVEGILCDSTENIVLIPSTSQPIVNNIITNLNVLSRRYRIRLIGFPVWQRYNSIDPENFYNLNLTLLSPYYINYEASDVKEFVSRFRMKFKTEPNDFSFRAYDICIYFTKALKHFGKNFLDYINVFEEDLLQGEFQLERAGIFGGFENKGLYFINYDKNFRIRHSILQNRETETFEIEQSVAK